MKYKKLFPAFLFAFLLITSKSYSYVNDSLKETRIMIITEFGTIKIKLYNETPLHRDNFIKLVKTGYFDSLMFHRVIKNFVVQGGDPDSKNAPANVELGNGGPGYTIPAEFHPKLFHKKGVLAAARDSDLENPSQASAGSQFYIVHGKIHTDSTLKVQAQRITKLKLFNVVVKRKEYKYWLEKYPVFVKKNQEDSMKYVNDLVNKQVEAELPAVPVYTFSEEQLKTYKTTGGTPHLDQSYTIFGEVYEGLNVVDEIANQKTAEHDRPVKDVRMKIVILE